MVNKIIEELNKIAQGERFGAISILILGIFSLFSKTIDSLFIFAISLGLLLVFLGIALMRTNITIRKNNEGNEDIQKTSSITYTRLPWFIKIIHFFGIIFIIISFIRMYMIW